MKIKFHQLKQEHNDKEQKVRSLSILLFHQHVIYSLKVQDGVEWDKKLMILGDQLMALRDDAERLEKANNSV